ncbi:MAG: CocE/NonD family hydrolase [Roseiarcus sp.]|jgi:dienelactone hydrolase
MNGASTSADCRRRSGAPRLLLAALAACLALCVATSRSARAAEDADVLDASLHERVVRIAVGEPPVELEVTIFAPDGAGPFPVAILNHGKDEGLPRDAKRYRSVYAARYFLSRGYAVVVPMMRGFSKSGGETWLKGCDLEAMGANQARDIRDVIRALPRQDIGVAVEAGRVIVFGQSMGGWNTLALGALAMPEVRGLVDFAGGVRAPECPSWQDKLVEAARNFGRTAKTPSIWFYGDNDSKFQPAVWRAMERGYAAGGAPVELVAYGPFMKDSHNFLGMIEALPIWTPKLDAFLERIGMPHAPLHPELLPAPYPPPSGFAALDDVSALPLAADAGRADYQKFLLKEPPRAFLVATNGSTVSTNGGYDPLERARALCAEKKLRCGVYAIDDQVVWPKPLPRPQPTHFAAIDDVGAVPYLKGAAPEGYRRFLTLPKPRAFVIAPDGAWAFSARDFDVLASALRNCQQKHEGCRPYAIDDDVVWARE